jgi:hypothetical protein
MRHYERVFFLGLVGALVGAVVINCGSGVCERYSDCASGLTCARGHCVAPPSDDDASADTGADVDAQPMEAGLGTDGSAEANAADGSTADGADASNDGAAEADALDATLDSAVDGSADAPLLDGAGPG